MNSTIEIWSVREVAKTLSKINNCNKTKKFEYTDGSTEEAPCTIECMCDECINDMAGLLEWAEDLVDNNETAEAMKVLS